MVRGMTPDPEYGLRILAKAQFEKTEIDKAWEAKKERMAREFSERVNSDDHMNF